MFSLQEYQHVHLLWFKKRSFTLGWKPNPPLRSVRGAHLRARADAASESTMGALLPLCIRAASALPLLCLRVRCETRLYWSARTWSVKSFSCYNVLQLAARAVWGRCFGAAQTMHSHKCDHVKFLLAHSQKMSQSRALQQHIHWCLKCPSQDVLLCRAHWTQ